MGGDRRQTLQLLLCSPLMSDEPAQNGGPPDELETEETPKPKSAEEAKAARSMDSMQANKEATTSADVDDAKLATVSFYE